jgi:hypothetical protein
MEGEMSIKSILLYTSLSLVMLTQYNSAHASFSKETNKDAAMESLQYYQEMSPLLENEQQMDMSAKNMAAPTDTESSKMTFGLNMLRDIPKQDTLNRSLPASVNSLLAPDIADLTAQIKENHFAHMIGFTTPKIAQTKNADKRFEASLDAFMQMYNAGLE